MDKQIVAETYRASLAGEINFTGVVAEMIRARVEYYQVDLAALEMTAYGIEGGVLKIPLPFKDLPHISPHFSHDSLTAALVDSRRHDQHYPDFIKRAMTAGVQSYFAFFRGKRVVYISRQGDLHTEWFPGVRETNPTH